MRIFTITTLVVLGAAGFYVWHWIFSGLPEVKFGGQEQVAEPARQEHAATGYDPARIKAAMTSMSTAFQITGWQRNEADNAWIATTQLEHAVISVGEKNSGVIAAVNDNTDAAVTAMLRCLALGEIAIQSQERERLKGVITAAAQNQRRESIELSSVTFAVEPQEVGGQVFLSCMLSPVVGV